MAYTSCLCLLLLLFFSFSLPSVNDTQLYDVALSRPPFPHRIILLHLAPRLIQAARKQTQSINLTTQSVKVSASLAPMKRRRSLTIKHIVKQPGRVKAAQIYEKNLKMWQFFLFHFPLGWLRVRWSSILSTRALHLNSLPMVVEHANDSWKSFDDVQLPRRSSSSW